MNRVREIPLRAPAHDDRFFVSISNTIFNGDEKMEGKWIFLPLRQDAVVQFINSLTIWGPSNDSDLGNGLQPRGIRLDAQDDRAKRQADSKARGTTHRDVQHARTRAETRHHTVLSNGQAFSLNLWSNLTHGRKHDFLWMTWNQFEDYLNQVYFSRNQEKVFWRN